MIRLGVSVFSGTGLPGLSRTKAVKRLCVCVCVCVRVCACVFNVSLSSSSECRRQLQSQVGIREAPLC